MIFLKAWPNARSISTQHLAILLGTRCCISFATLLRYFARCWIKFKNGQIFPATFRCCIMLYSFGLVHATLLHKGMRTRSTGCAPGASGTLTSTCSSKMLKLLRAFGQPVQHMSQHLAKILQDVAFRRCQRLARPLNHKSSWVYVTCSVTRGLPIHFCLRYSTIFFARSFFLRYLFWIVDVCFFSLRCAI